MPCLLKAPICVTQSQHADLMRVAFNQICDPDDWKAPIDCIVPWDLANLYMQAIEFMTGVRPNYQSWEPDVRNTADTAQARLTCCGYRAGPAGG